MIDSDSQQRADEARIAGRGVVSIATSKLYFIVATYGVFLALPRLLKTPAEFGLYAATISVASILNNVLIQGTIQTVSKRVSENLPAASVTLRHGLRLQLIVGGVVGGGLLLIAPYFAEHVMLDEQMGPLLRITSAVVFSYAMYAALIGSLNGRQLFQRQAALDATFTTLRTGGIVGAAALGFGVIGAVTGFAGASVVLLMIALAAVGIGRSNGDIAWKKWFAFMLPLWLYHLSLNLALQVDLIVLKRTVTAIAVEASTLPDAAARLASSYAGFYRAAQTFAFVPYQLIISVAFVVFPMVSRAVSQDDHQATRLYIRQAMRFSLLLLLAVAAPISGASAGVMRIAYPEPYLAGSGALAVLAFGIVFFALFVIGATVLSGAGHPARAAVIGGTAVLIIVAANVILLNLVGIGDHTLEAAALGTSVGTGFALVAVGITVYRRFGAFIPLSTLIRATTAGAVGFSVAKAVPHESALLAVVALLAGAMAYLGALLLVREVGLREMEALRRLLPFS